MTQQQQQQQTPEDASILRLCAADATPGMMILGAVRSVDYDAAAGTITLHGAGKASLARLAADGSLITITKGRSGPHEWSQSITVPKGSSAAALALAGVTTSADGSSVDPSGTAEWVRFASRIVGHAAAHGASAEYWWTADGSGSSSAVRSVTADDRTAAAAAALARRQTAAAALPTPDATPADATPDAA